MLYKNIVFQFLDRNLISDGIVNVIFMLIMIGIMVFIINNKKIELNIFPNKNKKAYIILTILLLAFIVCTLFIAQIFVFSDILFFFYGSILTIIFEELIFRGFVWKELELNKNNIYAYVITTVLFGLWHIGYVDTIIWRTSIFNVTENIGNIMLMKTITGGVLGVMFGFLRYKTKNVYSSMLLHALVNTIGK